jgi:hypothetical protein
MNLSHTSMADYRRCKVRFYWKYMKNYDPLPSEGLRRGSIGHAALAEWYRSKDREKAIQIASDKLFEFENILSADLSSEWDLISIILDRYFDWSLKNDRFKCLEIEKKYSFELDGLPAVFIIDGIVEDMGNLWVLEHKFVKKAYLSHIDLDMQLSIYIYAARKLGYPVTGAIYNVIRVGAGGIAEKEPVLRKLVYRNPEGMEVIEKELQVQAREIKEFLDNEGNPLYRNPTKDCSWDCGFYRVCLSVNDNGDADCVLRTYPVREQYKGELIDDGD